MGEKGNVWAQAQAQAQAASAARTCAASAKRTGGSKQWQDAWLGRLGTQRGGVWAEETEVRYGTVTVAKPMVTERSELWRAASALVLLRLMRLLR